MIPVAARLHHRHRRRRPIGAHAGDGGGATGLSLPYLRARSRLRRRRGRGGFHRRARSTTKAALTRFAAEIDVATYEFENIATAPLAALAELVPLHPSVEALTIAQDRLEEKNFIQRHGGRPAPVRPGRRPRGARRGAWRRSAPRPSSRPGASAMTARARSGSTTPERGRCRLAGGARRALRARRPWSASTPNSRSCSAATPTDRSRSGPRRATATTAASSSRSSVPAGPELAAAIAEGEALARRVAEALDYVGVMAMEFFAVGGRGDVQRNGAARPQ